MAQLVWRVTLVAELGSSRSCRRSRPALSPEAGICLTPVNCSSMLHNRCQPLSSNVAEIQSPRAAVASRLNTVGDPRNNEGRRHKENLRKNRAA
jgi:hypothetical protein